VKREGWRKNLSQLEWRKMLPYAPIAAFIVVVAAALGMDLAFSGPDNPTIANSAPPPEVVRATIDALPVTATPYVPPPTATVTAGPTALPEYFGMLSDRTRMDDLAKIAGALEQYRQQKGEYPSTGGNTQTVCIYQDIDAGCKLRDLLDPIPGDPAGDPGANGYWYRSDGKSYMLAAAMAVATNATPLICDPEMAKLIKHTTLYCVASSP
jgi:hypothetical protein